MLHFKAFARVVTSRLVKLQKDQYVTRFPVLVNRESPIPLKCLLYFRPLIERPFVAGARDCDIVPI